jgi:Ni2+-binding GTPase involved in maturation of urease and hydrogenase
MLVPHTCSKTNDDMTLWDEYKEIRQGVALDHASLKVLNGNMTNQDCETFGVHPRLGSLQKMFNDRDLLFFTNTGELTKETDKENYWRDTKTQLFAHNFQQQAAQRIDPLKAIDGTGILGRIRDILVEKKGRNVGAYSLNVNSMCLIGEPGTTSTPMIVSDAGATPFNQFPSLADMDSRINLLNGKTEAESGVFADFHAEAVIKSLSNNKVLVDTLTGKTTQVVFPTSGLGKQLSMVAKMIDSRAVRNSDADMFFVETGGCK